MNKRLAKRLMKQLRKIIFKPAVKKKFGLMGGNYFQGERKGDVGFKKGTEIKALHGYEKKS